MTAQRLRVFVVEDHDGTAANLKRFLEVSGYTVDVANDVRSALKAAETAEFDVLLCDLNLPDGTGWDLMKRLRKLRAVRGIAYSAFAEPEHVERSKSVGFVDHIAKGSAPEELVAAIERAMAT